MFLRQLIAKAIGGDRPFGRLLMEYLQRRQQASPGNAASHTDDYLMSELEAILRDGKRK